MKTSKIMLQGYLHDANFGDVLSAHLFYRRCQQLGFREIDFFQYKNLGIGDFCRRELGYTKRKSVLSCLWADAYVVIAGGSFWNSKSSARDAKTRYRRFIWPGLLYQLMGKPVYLLGVGGGHVDTLWLRTKMIRLMNRSKRVLFRDEFTRQVFADYGVKNNLEVTADTALVIQPDMLEAFEEKNRLEQMANGRKKLLLHFPDGPTENRCVVEKVLPALIPFLKEHGEYLPVLSNDNVRRLGQDEQQEIAKVRQALDEAGIPHYDYVYHSCWQMCSLIREMDCIVTLKLHVGVVGCALGKSVVSFPVHREKTDNFYKMIGESERCVNVRNLDVEKASEQIRRFHDKPVHISDELRRKAEMNLSVLDGIVRESMPGELKES